MRNFCLGLSLNKEIFVLYFPHIFSVSELQRAGVQEAPTTLFSHGQVIKVRVVTCDPQRRRMVVCEANAPAHERKAKLAAPDGASSAAGNILQAHRIGSAVRGAKLVGIDGEGIDAVLQVDLRYNAHLSCKPFYSFFFIFVLSVFIFTP